MYGRLIESSTDHPAFHPLLKKRIDQTKPTGQNYHVSGINIWPNAKPKVVSAKPERYSFASSDGHFDQLVMKTPRRLKEDVGNNFLYLFVEKRESKNKFQSSYDTKPQIAVAGTKQTITTDTNKIIHRKRASE